jgi:pyruvate/2-oxoglutarate dehydrogenase complex dihydrolipoamide acyltransferase (E2) component
MLLATVVLLVALTHVTQASAWAWPVDGPVLRPFVADDDPYAGGQHRGIDVGAPTGTDVRASATGVVAFAGQLPHEGLCLTIRTAGGYSVTLVHLGSIGVRVGTAVGEGEVVGTVGPSGEPEGPEPYVHLGIRLTAEPNGYVDPLSLLPVRHAPEQPPAEQTQAAAPAPTASVAAPVSPRATASPAPRTKGSARGQRAPRARVAPRPSLSARPIGARTGLKAARSNARLGTERPTPSRTSRNPAQASRLPSPRPPAVSSAISHTAVAQAQTERASTRPTPVRNARRAAQPAATVGEQRRPKRVLLAALGLVGLALVAVGATRRRVGAVPATARFAREPLRKMSDTEPGPEERLAEPPTTANFGRRRMALRERPAASRPCSRLRRAVGHHRALSPTARRSGPDGRRYGRAWNAGHGRGRSRRPVAA